MEEKINQPKGEKMQNNSAGPANLETKIGWIFLGVIITSLLIYAVSASGIITGNASSSAVDSTSGEVQEINMDVDYSGYSPNSFVLKKGVPVKWIINVKELTGCNNRIISQELNIDKKLQKGKNIIEFTPDKTGTIGFSCWMNMIKGTFIITEDGKATNEQVAAAKPSAVSCGGGCGGGCGGRCGGGSGSCGG